MRNKKVAAILMSIFMVSNIATNFAYAEETTGSAVNTESTESIEITENTETTESVESTENTENTETTESTGTVIKDTTFTENKFTYTISAATKTAVLKKYSGSEKKITIPSTIIYNGEEYNVTTIREKFLSSASNIEEVVISEGITTIKYMAFYRISTIKSVEMPDTVTSIGNAAFFECTSLENVKLSGGLTSLGYSVFYNCTSLKEITIPDSVTKIEDGPESDGESIQEVLSGAFQNCTALEKVTLGTGLKKIGAKCFENCTSLSDIELHEGLEVIGSKAFYNCRGLTVVKIPASVTEIGEIAYENCGLTADEFYEGTVDIYDFKIIGEENSAAQAYAKNEGKEFYTFEEYEAYLLEEQRKKEEYEKREANPIVEETVPLGDVNDDGYVDAKDAVIILTYYANTLAQNTYEINEEVADINSDNSIDAKDATKILIYYAQHLAGDSRTFEEYVNFYKLVI